MQKLLIIDGNALLHRAYHALPDFKRKDGMPTNAIYGFASVLHKVREEIQPTHLVVCFDTAAPTFRDELYKEYRTHRPETDKDLIQQFPIARDFLKAAGIAYCEKDGMEADDLIAAITLQAKGRGFTTIILTGDKDIFQLVDGQTFILTPAIGFSKGVLYNREEVIKKFGVPPEKIADLKALMGDSSDNYKGVKGIGPKTAVQLISSFDSIENIYKHINEVEPLRIRQLLIDHKEHALLSKELAVLKNTIDGFDPSIDRLAFSQYSQDLRNFFETYEFNSLERRYFSVRPDSQKQKLHKESPSKKEKDQLGLF